LLNHSVPPGFNFNFGGGARFCRCTNRSRFHRSGRQGRFRQGEQHFWRYAPSLFMHATVRTVLHRWLHKEALRFDNWSSRIVQNIIAIPRVARELFGASAAVPARDETQGDTCGRRHGAKCLECSPRLSLFHCQASFKFKVLRCHIRCHM